VHKSSGEQEEIRVSTQEIEGLNKQFSTSVVGGMSLSWSSCWGSGKVVLDSPDKPDWLYALPEPQARSDGTVALH
jgi:hypothetical protein